MEKVRFVNIEQRVALKLGERLLEKLSYSLKWNYSTEQYDLYFEDRCIDTHISLKASETAISFDIITGDEVLEKGTLLFKDIEGNEVEYLSNRIFEKFSSHFP